MNTQIEEKEQQFNQQLQELIGKVFFHEDFRILIDFYD